MLVYRAADARAVLVEERDPSAGDGQGVIPATGLLPVPGGAVGLAAGLFASHGFPQIRQRFDRGRGIGDTRWAGARPCRDNWQPRGEFSGDIAVQLLHRITTQWLGA